jgi:perosamine synthetase
MSFLRKKDIPISKPYIGYFEYKYALKSLQKNIIGGASENNIICEKIISDVVKHKHCKLASNGTVALQVAFEATKFLLKKDNLTIIVPNITFGATVNAALLTSNNVILADVDEETGLLRRESVQNIIDQNDVDCICLVSLNGRLVSVEDIKYYAQNGILLIEDQAEALISQYEGNLRSRYIFMSTLSFYANKIVTSGEGGAICFSNENMLEWVTTYMNHGMSMPGTYKHQQIGSNYRMSSFNAGLLRGQLSRLDKVISHRKDIWTQFSSIINDSQNSNLYKKNEIPWLLEYKANVDKDIFEKQLEKKGIQYRRYFSPMSEQPAFKKLSTGPLLHSYKFVDKRYFLPLYYGMSNAKLLRVIDAIIR